MHGLRCGNGRVRITHGGRRNDAALQYQGRFDCEKRRLPEHYICELTDLDGSHFMRNAVRDGRVYRVLGDVALDTEIVGAALVLMQTTALRFHLVCNLPG